MKDFNKKASAADIVILLVIMLVAAYMFVASNSFADETKLFPQIVSATVFICCAAKLGLMIWAIGTSKCGGRTEAVTAQEKKTLFTKKQLMVLVVSVIYVAILNFVGFLISTIIVLIVLPYMLGYHRWKVLVPFAVIVTVAFYMIFRYGFYIKLPAGILSGIL